MISAAPRASNVASSVSQNGARVLTISGRLELAGAGDVWEDIRGLLETFEKGTKVDIDMSDVEAIDGGTMALLVHLRGQLAARGVTAEFAGARDDVQSL